MCACTGNVCMACAAGYGPDGNVTAPDTDKHGSGSAPECAAKGADLQQDHGRMGSQSGDCCRIAAVEDKSIRESVTCGQKSVSRKTHKKSQKRKHQFVTPDKSTGI